MPKKINNTAEAVRPEQDKYLPTANTPLVSAPGQGGPDQGGDQTQTPPQTPPYDEMGLDPHAVLSFALREDVWVVVTADGQKHRWPVDA